LAQENAVEFTEGPLATGAVALRSATLNSQIRQGMRLPRGASAARMSPVLRMFGLGGHAGRTPARRRTHADENQTSSHHHLPRSSLVQVPAAPDRGYAAR